MAVHKRHEASARLAAAHRKDLPPLLPRTRWVGGDNHAAVPINTAIGQFDKELSVKGLHVLDLFSGISCGGLRSVLEANYKVSWHTSVEINDISRVIARKTLNDLQEEYSGQLPDSAISR